MQSIVIIVFLPLLAAIVGGLGNRALGNTVVKSLTTGALFVSCALSWPIFLAFVSGSAQASVAPVLQWVHSGDLTFDWALRVDALTAVMLVVVTTVSAPGGLVSNRVWPSWGCGTTFRAFWPGWISA